MLKAVKLEFSQHKPFDWNVRICHNYDYLSIKLHPLYDSALCYLYNDLYFEEIIFSIMYASVYA